MAHEDQILQFSPASQMASPQLVAHSTRLDDSPASALAGNSQAAVQLRAQIRRVAPYFRAVALTGEPGCGAESTARTLHQMCPLHEQEFVVLDAGAAEARFSEYPASPDAPKEGLLYLAEAEKLSSVAQQELLKLLRQQTTRSTRIVAFVGRGLKPYIAAGSYSPELAAMLGSLRIALPSLRERSADIPALIHSRLQQRRNAALQGTGTRGRPIYLAADFLSAAGRFPWPGNLYQLQAVVDWLLQNKDGGSLHADDLTTALDGIAQSSSSPAAEPRLISLDQLAREHTRAVLMACNGNKLRAAEVLGISRSTLYRMLEAAESPAAMLLAG